MRIKRKYGAEVATARPCRWKTAGITTKPHAALGTLVMLKFAKMSVKNDGPLLASLAIPLEDAKALHEALGRILRGAAPEGN